MQPTCSARYRVLILVCAALAAMPVAAIAQFGQPRTEYRCLTCGQRFSHHVTRCPTCASVGRMNRDSATRREQSRRNQQRMLERVSKDAKESRRQFEKQIQAARKKSSSDDSSYGSGRRVGRLVRWVLIVVAVIASGVGYMNTQKKQKRKVRLSQLRGTAANPLIDVPGEMTSDFSSTGNASADEFADITDFAAPADSRQPSRPPRPTPNRRPSAPNASSQHPPAAARPAPPAAPANASRPPRRS